MSEPIFEPEEPSVEENDFDAFVAEHFIFVHVDVPFGKSLADAEGGS